MSRNHDPARPRPNEIVAIDQAGMARFRQGWNMGKRAPRVTIVEGNEARTLVSPTDGKGRKRLGKQKIRDRIGWLWPVEHVMNEYLRAESRCWGDMLRRHDKSRAKKRDRWLTDGLMSGLRSHNKACMSFFRRI